MDNEMISYEYDKIRLVSQENANYKKIINKQNQKIFLL